MKSKLAYVKKQSLYMFLLVGLLSLILQIVGGYSVKVGATTTKPPGCYAMAGPGLTNVNCNTLKAFFPEITIDPAKCYITTQSNTTYTTPSEVPCSAVPVPGDPIPTPPDAVSQKPPIPIGCPGSTIQGPPTPENLALCATIPIGCPGSTLQGPPGPGFSLNNCPYGTSQPIDSPEPFNTTTSTCYQGTISNGVKIWSTPNCTIPYRVGIGITAFEPGKCYIADYTQEPTLKGEIDCAVAATRVQNQCQDINNCVSSSSSSGVFNGPISASVNTLPQVQANKAAIENAIKIVFAIAGAIAVLIIAISGFKYAMSMGEPTKTARAKDTILYAVIGLAVVVLANFIVIYVVNSLVA